MLTKQETKNLGKLLAMFAEAVNGAVRGIEARHVKIASSVADRMPEIIGDIEQAVAAGDYAPSVSYQLKSKLAELREKLQAFSAAVQTGSVTQGKVVGRWVKDLAGELAGLLGIE
jgi:hypothetical protein